MWKGMVSFKVCQEDRKYDVNNFDDFFSLVQKKTGFFNTRCGDQLIPYKLFEQQKNWLQLFEKGRPQRRALLASRDKGKSEIVSILGTAWHLFKRPYLKIGIMSFKYENAEKLVIQILKILESLGMILESRSGGYYTQAGNAHTPNLMAMGLLSTVRGMHFDYLILDDPLTINEQFSKKYIQRSRYFLNEGASLATSIILIGQLLTRHDIFYDAYGDSTGKYFVLQSWHGDIPELDKDLRYLRSTIGEKDLARNYLGYIHESEDAIFQSLQFETQGLENLGKSFAFIDPSSKGKDYTAVCLGYFFDGRIVIYGKSFKAHWGLCLESLVDLCKESEIVYFEDNMGSALGTFLRDKGVHAFGVTTHANKIAKIYALRALALADRMRLSNAMDAHDVMQIKTWTETAEHDDLPDCMAMLVQRMGWVFEKC